MTSSGTTPVLPDRIVQHWLLVADDVESAEVHTLAACRFPAAALDGEVLRLSRHSSLHGPWAGPMAPVAGQEALERAGMPLHGTVVFLLQTLRERSDPIPFATGDRDGLRRSFPAGLPDREEGRAVAWLVAAARRLTGKLIFDGADGPRPAGQAEWRVLHPDPEVDTDLAVISDVWLTPQAAEAVCRTIEPAAQLGATCYPWSGPPAQALRSTLDPAALDDADIAALSTQQVLEGYAVLVPGAGGIVAVEVTGVSEAPTALRGVPWLEGGGVQYTVRWCPDDDEAAQREFPEETYRRDRGHGAMLVSVLTRALKASAGGEILDQNGFPLTVEDL